MAKPGPCDTASPRVNLQVPPAPSRDVDFLETALAGRKLRNGMLVQDWLDDVWQREDRRRSIRGLELLSPEQFYGLFLHRLGPLAAPGTPTRDAWEIATMALHTRRMAERETKVQERRKQRRPAVIETGSDPATVEGDGNTGVSDAEIEAWVARQGWTTETRPTAAEVQRLCGEALGITRPRVREVLSHLPGHGRRDPKGGRPRKRGQPKNLAETSPG